MVSGAHPSCFQRAESLSLGQLGVYKGPGGLKAKPLCRKHLAALLPEAPSTSAQTGLCKYPQCTYQQQTIAVCVISKTGFFAMLSLYYRKAHKELK